MRVKAQRQDSAMKNVYEKVSFELRTFVEQL